jgi:glycosyltransferase involved in cell wall biosynthesis
LSEVAFDRRRSAAVPLGDFLADLPGAAWLPQQAPDLRAHPVEPIAPPRLHIDQQCSLCERPRLDSAPLGEAFVLARHRGGARPARSGKVTKIVPVSPRLRVLQIASFYAPTIGGMETVLQDLAEGLVATGDSVTILCAAEGPRGAREVRGGVTVVRSPSLGKWFSQPMTPLLPMTLARLAESVDVAHVHMPNPIAELATVLLPRRLPVVATYHADIIRQRALWPLFVPTRRAILARARCIVVPTEQHVRYSEVLPPLREKCTVVPFGISAQRYQLDDAGRARAGALRAKHGKFVLFVGRLVHYKGVTTLIESMRDVDAELVILGDGPERPAAEAAVTRHGLGARVSVVGAVSQPELNAHLEACAVLALPSVSRSENFGMILLEGMLFGKALVTSRLQSGVEALNEDTVTGLKVAPRDPRALAVALSKLLSDEALRATMGAAARARLESHFSLAQMISGYRAVYRQAISR